MIIAIGKGITDEFHSLLINQSDHVPHDVARRCLEDEGTLADAELSVI